MALPVLGKTYRFKCAGSSTRYLNLYSSGSASDGMNVVLYDSDSSNEQKWKYSGSKLLSMTDTSFALDKYTLSGNANNNNADIWTANDPDNQNITFVSVSGNTVRIKLAGSSMYLTAYSNTNGTGTGKTPTSAGNVYWAASSSSKMQQWTFEEVSGGSPTTRNYATYPVQTMKIMQGYNDGNHADYSDYPFDEACEDSGSSWIHCPCDEMKISKKYTTGSVNTVWVESTSPVDMPCGTDILTFLVMHVDDLDMDAMSVGDTFNRGDPMFPEGMDGASAYHFHISCGKGKYTGTGWVGGANNSWSLATSGGCIKAEQAFYLDSKGVSQRPCKWNKAPTCRQYYKCFYLHAG